MMKSFKSKHKDINKGEDPRSNTKLVEMKKKKLLDKLKQSKSIKKGQKKPINEKSWNKIV